MSGRVPTGIDGLDPLIEGGFLRGDVILVAGGTGSGKTIFSTQFIYNGAIKYGEKGAYAMFEEDSKTLKRDMLRFGFDVDKLEQEGTIKLIDLETLKGGGLNASLRGLFSDQISFGKEGIQTIKLSKAAEVGKVET